MHVGSLALLKGSGWGAGCVALLQSRRHGGRLVRAIRGGGQGRTYAKQLRPLSCWCKPTEFSDSDKDETAIGHGRAIWANSAKDEAGASRGPLGRRKSGSKKAMFALP